MSKIFCKTEGSGQPVILIHGFCETSEIWSGFSTALASNNKVYSIDLPGFGESPLPEAPFTIDEIARVVIEWMDENKIVYPILIGHSLGGYIALAIAEKAAEKIRGIVLFHSTAYPDSKEKKANRNKVIEFVQKHGVDPFVDSFIPGLFYDKNHPDIPLVDRIARKTSPETLINYSMAMRDRPSRVEFLKTFKKKYLILGGQMDTVIPLEISLQLGELNPNGFSFILLQVAHMGMFEQPESALKNVEEFIISTIK